MRELRKHFNQDFWDTFSSWNRRNPTNFIFPAMLVVYVAKRFDIAILNRFCSSPEEYRALVLSIASI